VPGSRRDDENGFTLVEVIVAMVLFGVLVASVATTLVALVGHTRGNQNRAVALNIANRVLDRLHSVPALQLPNGPLPPEVYRVDRNEFTVRTTGALVAEGTSATGSACDGASGGLSEKRLSVVVTWTGMGSTRPVRSDTVRRLDLAELDPTLGTVTVKVTDRANNPLAGQAVTLNPGNLRFTTADDGCAVFSRLAPGGYSASLSTSGYVSNQQLTSPARAVTAVAGQVIRDAGFQYDRAGSVTAQWTSVGVPLSSYSTPTWIVPDAVGVTLRNAGFAGGRGRFEPCGVSATTECASAPPGGRAVGGLFPASEGYVAWAGTCQDAEPAAGASAAAVFDPGGVGTTSLSVTRVLVTVRDRYNNPAAGQSVTITHAADAGCPGGLTITSPSSDSQGLVYVALPLGLWRLQAGAGGATSLTLATTSAQPATVTVSLP
jgi:prepilin-type N-terminal cleavage/methylation domain-containing protein